MERQPHYIREWRKYRALSLEQLSVVTGMSHPALSRLERGLRPYTQRSLDVVARALGCTPADLIMRDPWAGEDIWQLWASLRPDERDQALTILKVLRRTGTDG